MYNIGIMKTCTKCHITKSLSEFSPRLNRPANYTSSCRKCAKIYRSVHKQEISDRMREWRKENQERLKEYRRGWRAKNQVRKIERDRKYREENKEKLNAWRREWYKLKRLQSPMLRLRHAIKADVYKALKGHKPTNTFNLLGYTIAQLKYRLESQFVDGMNWENYGAWHIDHIIPQSFFIFDSPDDVEFKMCWRLENLQPLWAKDNLRKSNRLSPTG